MLIIILKISVFVKFLIRMGCAGRGRNKGERRGREEKWGEKRGVGLVAGGEVVKKPAEAMERFSDVGHQFTAYREKFF